MCFNKLCEVIANLPSRPVPVEAANASSIAARAPPPDTQSTHVMTVSPKFCSSCEHILTNGYIGRGQTSRERNHRKGYKDWNVSFSCNYLWANVLIENLAR